VTTQYPLSAIVGQRSLIDALLIIAVAPDVGGVLVRGERGTAKSTAVRGLASLLPPVRAADSQPFAFAPGEAAPDGPVSSGAPTTLRAAPLVELPLGATLDRLVGTLHLGRALAGEQKFEPGMLARAHQGILYVDEVNLLPDHLVDALLDAAASGVAHVEREAVSVSHAARFRLVGTMNVEEGELRPQLLDRFGLGVDVRTPSEVGERAEIVRRRRKFERDPQAFGALWAGEEERLRERIAAAGERLESVVLPERELMRITGACARLGVDGVRGDIVSARAAQALAALDGASEVREDDVRRAVALALAHRRHSDPLGSASADDRELEEALEDVPPDTEPPPDDAPPDRPPPGGPRGAHTGRPAPADAGGNGQPPPGPAPEPARPPSGGPARAADDRPPEADPTLPVGERRDPPEAARLPLAALALDGRGRGPSGRRARTAGPGAGAIDSRPAGPESDDLALVATLRAHLLEGAANPLREHVRAGSESTLLCLVVDASGSMGARRRLARVKGALVSVLRDAYARRDRVGVIAFRAAAAQVAVAPGTPIERAADAIRELATGGRTPLAEGLAEASRLIRRERGRGHGRRAIAIVLTDGRAQDPLGDVRRAARGLGRVADAVHVIDTEDGPVRLGLAADLADAAGGLIHHLAPAPRTHERAA
jgi:magnesium chelatase subunit D